MASSSIPTAPRPSFAASLLALAVWGSPTAAFTTPQLPPRGGLARLDSPLFPRQSHPPARVAQPDLGGSPADRSPAFATRLGLFGNLFGQEEVQEDQLDLGVGELARFSYELPAEAKPEVKFDSLSIMIAEWAKLFADDENKMGLTTPVEVARLTSSATDRGGDVANVCGARLLFVKRKSGYADKDEKKYEEQGKKEKEEAIKEGGVEVRVQQSSGGDLTVTALRCEVEEGTMVKEMSEQTIVDSLRKTMAAWKKEQSQWNELAKGSD